MKKYRPFLALLIAITFLVHNGQAQQPLKSSQIDSLVNKTMATMPLAGLAVAVVKDGKVIHAKGYGITSVKTKEKVDENTLFAIASNSKAFTTMALALLVDDGKLRWQDKVVDYIPEFKMYDPYVTANFNIQDLLTHRSGLGLGAGDLMFFPDGGDFTIKDVLKSFQYQKPVSAFRTKYDYDNLLYIVAGEVVARVSGQSWADFVENRIMKPLGMTRSASVYQNLKDKKNTAMPHAVEKGELKQLETYTKNDASIGAAGGIYASVNDLSKWMLMHLNGGKYGEGLKSQLVSAANHREMLRPHTFLGFNSKPDPTAKVHFNAYGLGWGIADLNGYIIFSHTGGLPGMLSKTTLVPELNLGIIVLTNTDPGGFSFQTISRSIADSYLGIKVDRISQAMKTIKEMDNAGDSVTTAVWNTVKNAKADHLKLENFVGTYRDNWFGNVTITLKDGQLWFTSMRSPKLHGKMSFYKANTFAIRWDYQDMNCDAFATFSLDEEGNANGIKLKGISPNIDFSFDFQDLDLKKIAK
ncbi:MAG: serine hydrolase [Bacteroidetes bacterium]|nr:serine hydrolase [Bacteroidota bacterium]